MKTKGHYMASNSNASQLNEASETMVICVGIVDATCLHGSGPFGQLVKYQRYYVDQRILQAISITSKGGNI